MPDHCVAELQLKNYALGLLDDDSSAEIEQHISVCESCGSAVSSFDGASDSVMRSLRLKPTELLDDTPSWIERLANSPGLEDLGESEPTTNKKIDPLLIGEYRLQRVIGRGGMSTVFLAEHERLGRSVAFKVLRRPASTGRKAIERFCREMKLAGSMSHPAIVQVTDAGECDSIHYLVMEHIDGIDLSRMLYHSGPLKIADACRIAYDIADALVHAHDAGVIHRDIKPSNVMLNRIGHIKLLDFGLARLTSTTSEVTEHTTVGQLLGTLDYMAPEQANSESVDERADVYSLGATLFRLLTGQPPHGRSSETPLLEFVRRLGCEEAPALAEIRTDIPLALTEIVAHSLANKHSDRIASAAEFRDVLKQFVSGSNLESLAAEFPENTGSMNQGDNSKIADGSTDLHEAIAELSPQRAFALSAQSPPADVSRTNNEPLPNTRSGDGLHFGWLKYLLPFAFVGVLWGVTILVETKQGTIRIESEVDDIKVELVDESEAVTSLQVNRSGTESEILAGRYRVRIAGESDSVQIKPSQLTISNGKQATITVTQMPQKQSDRRVTESTNPLLLDKGAESEQADVGQQQLLDLKIERAVLAESYGAGHPRLREIDTKISVIEKHLDGVPDQPVYKGYTLDHWEALLKYETNREKRVEAIYACHSFMNSIDEERRCDLLVAILQVHSEIDERPTLLLMRMESRSEHLALQRLNASEDKSIIIQRISIALGNPATREGAFCALAAFGEHARQHPIEWQSVINKSRTVEANVSRLNALNINLVLPENEARTNLLQAIEKATTSYELKSILAIAAERDGLLDRKSQLRAVSKLQILESEWDWPEQFERVVMDRAWQQQTAQEREDWSTFLKPMFVHLEEVVGDYDLLIESNSINRPFGRFCKFAGYGAFNDNLRRKAIELLQQALDTLRQTADSQGRPDSECGFAMQSTIRALIVLTGKFPDVAKPESMNKVPDRFQSIAQDRTFPNSDPWDEYERAANAYPVEYMLAAQARRNWLDAQSSRHKKTAAREVPVVGKHDPMIVVAILADYPNQFQKFGATDLNYHFEATKLYRWPDLFLRNVNQLPVVQKMVFDWLRRPGADIEARWKFVRSRIKPSDAVVQFAADTVRHSQHLEVVREAAATLANWNEEKLLDSKTFRDIQEQARRRPTQYFSSVYWLFAWDENDVGDQMAKDYLLDIANGPAIDESESLVVGAALNQIDRNSQLRADDEIRTALQRLKPLLNPKTNEFTLQQVSEILSEHEDDSDVKDKAVGAEVP